MAGLNRRKARYDAKVQDFVFMWIAAAATLAAQQSRVVVDNDQVKALSVKVEPHQKTKLHRHTVNRVMIYLQAGKQNLDYQDGRRIVLDWKAGEVKWSPAAGMHVAEITTADPVTIAEIEIKGAGKQAFAPSALDPVKVDPKHYHVEFENDQVRVLRVRIGPHESTPRHEHVLNRVVTYLTPQHFRIESADGHSEESSHEAGDMSWGERATHRETNLSDQPFEVVVVELKD